MEYRLNDWSGEWCGEQTDESEWATNQGAGHIDAITTPLRPGYEMLPFSEGLIRQHATAKYESFKNELDSNVFPCLGNADGCLRLMKEIASRHGFVPEATWLCQHHDTESKTIHPVGTIQGIELDGWGAIQNIGVHPRHRNRGLGGQLLLRAAQGFYEAGLKGMHLEVTTDNTAAIRFYQRIGFRKAEVVYKAAEVVGS
jgi:ribosomal protein S18 acetylase RimI-like enzyme